LKKYRHWADSPTCANSYRANQEISHILWNPKIHCCAYKSPDKSTPLLPTLSLRCILIISLSRSRSSKWCYSSYFHRKPLYVFLCSTCLALDRGGSLGSHTAHFTPPPLKKFTPLITQEDPWDSEPARTLWRREKSLSTTRNKTAISPSSCQWLSHYSDYLVLASLVTMSMYDFH
jgi:hypothetical protein